MKRILIIVFGMAPLLASAQQILTLDECYAAAEENYPLAKQTVLLEERTNAEINALEKERLPKLGLNAQATYQSDVIQFPLEMPGFYVEPPNKDQYRATLDANQLIYNGGSIAANSRMKTAELETQQQQVAVNLYSLKYRINQNFFNVLMLQEQTKLLLSKMENLDTRAKEINTGVKYGVVLLSSEQVLQAETLKLKQQLSEIDYNRQKALDNLGALLSQDLDNTTVLEKPKASTLSDDQSQRPELKLFELQQMQLESSKEVISKANYPKIFGFAQAGYGNPGLNMLDNSFQDFYMLGVKLNWNILDWGNAKQKKQALDISKEIVSTERETFVLNNNMQVKEAQRDINKYEEMLQKDEEIISLREQVLDATTSQLQNGAITSSEYITELNNLYGAKIDKQLHEIQLALVKANYKVIKGDFK